MSILDIPQGAQFDLVLERIYEYISPFILNKFLNDIAELRYESSVGLIISPFYEHGSSPKTKISRFTLMSLQNSIVAIDYQQSVVALFDKKYVDEIGIDTKLKLVYAGYLLATIMTIPHYNNDNERRQFFESQYSTWLRKAIYEASGGEDGEDFFWADCWSCDYEYALLELTSTIYNDVVKPIFSNGNMKSSEWVLHSLSDFFPVGSYE